MQNPAPPLEWHPAYRDKTWLLDWLDGNYLDGRDPIRIPVVPPIRSMWNTDTEPLTAAAPTITMTKRKAWGPAPYVGRPFRYEWRVGVDNLGRQIAGESRIVYCDREQEWRFG